MSSGPSGHKLNSSFKTRNSGDYKRDLGQVVLSASRSIPDGLLVFFPSYIVMEQCVSFWKEAMVDSCTIWERIAKYKQPIVEPRDAAEFATVRKDRPCVRAAVEGAPPPGSAI